MEAPRPFDEVIERMRKAAPEAAAGPVCFYNKDGDTLEIYLERTPYVAERINTMLTAFVSEGDPNRVVGLAIKKIKKHFGEHGLLQFLVGTGRASIRLLVLGAEMDQEHHSVKRGVRDRLPDDRREILKRLLDDVGDVEIEAADLATA